MALTLSENEYRLVCVVLEQTPMRPGELTSLAAARLLIPQGEVRSLMDGLLERNVLTLDSGLVVSRITREEADQTAIDRALDFTPLWPAPTPPPGAEADSCPAPSEEPEKTGKAPSFFRRNNLALWVGALLGALVLSAIFWLAAERDRYPKLIQFEDGRIFIQHTEPHSAAQEAAAACLMDYARDQRWVDTPVFDLFQITSMEEYVTNPDWAAAQNSTQLLFSSIYNIASGHEGVVVFATAEHTVTETVPANPYENGVHIYRIYLTEETDGSWTVAGMECSEEKLYTEVTSSSVTIDGHDFTISFLGRRLSADRSNIYAILVSDGRSRQLLYLTEVPDTEGLGVGSLADLNNDGFSDLLIQRHTSDITALCYLYSPETMSFLLCPELCGTWFGTDSALPGTVHYYDNAVSENAASVQRFSRVNDDGTLTELARTHIHSLSGKATYNFYRAGELVHSIDLIPLTDEAQLTPQAVVDQFAPTAYWDELVLETAREHGCLELPQPTYFSSQSIDSPSLSTQISLIYFDYESNVAFYTSPSQLLLLRDGTDLRVFPVNIQDLHYNDLDGDGDFDLQGVTAWLSYPTMLWNGEDEWTMELLDTSGLEEEFTANCRASWTDTELALTYDGAYGTASLNYPIAPGETMSALLSRHSPSDPPRIFIQPEVWSGSYQSDFYPNETDFLSLRFRVLIDAAASGSSRLLQFATLTAYFSPSLGGSLVISHVEFSE